MRRLSLALLLVGVSPLFVSAQSLGEAAAKERARREKEKHTAAKPVRSYSNDDLEPPPADGAKKPASAPEPSPEGYGAGGGATPVQRFQEGSSEGTAPSDWQGRADAARRRVQEAEEGLAAARARVDAARQRLNPMSASYNADTNNGDTGTLLRLRSDLTEAEEALKVAEEATRPAQEAWAAFEREARAAGAPAEVLNPPSPPR